MNEVLPCVSTIVTVDPYWTWTAKHSDYVLPACNYWEKWDVLDRYALGVIVGKPCRSRRRAKASRTWRSCRCWHKKVGLEAFWNKTDEEWARGFVNAEHPAWEGFDFDQAVAEAGICAARKDGVFDAADRLRPDGAFPTPSTQLPAVQRQSWSPSQEEVPTLRSRCSEDPAGELGQKYPLVFLQFHDRLNVHSQHILIPELERRAGASRCSR